MSVPEKVSIEVFDASGDTIALNVVYPARSETKGNWVTWHLTTMREVDRLMTFHPNYGCIEVRFERE